jgi:hypothetical protein
VICREDKLETNMKSKVRLLFLFFLLTAYTEIKGLEIQQTSPDETVKDSTESVSYKLVDLLNVLAHNSTNEFFKRHCTSIIDVINAHKNITSYEENFLKNFYSALSDTNETWSVAKLSSYLERKRPFIVSWTSPTDGTVSLAWLIPPKNWDSDKSYPLYVWLHGLYSSYEIRIEYMVSYLCKSSTINYPFDDGYLLLPWARGNKWYEGKAETDVWESISATETTFKVDQTKKYLCGFSMGGYGTWYIGHRSPDKWAALGIFSGNFSYINQSVNANAAQKMKDVPVYIVCGDKDYLSQDNLIAYNLLKAAGNQNLFRTTFNGGHETNYENQKKMGDWLAQWTNENVNSINLNNLPQHFELYQNYPNPFNPSTSIQYELPASTNVMLKVFDIIGREVATLVDKYQQAGKYNAQFSTRWSGSLCSQLSSGVYFYTLKAGDFVQSKKMILIK